MGIQVGSGGTMAKAARFVSLLLASTITIPAQAQTTDADRARIERKLDELRAMREDMQRQMGTLQQQMGAFDNQIDSLETELRGSQPPSPQAATAAPGSVSGQQAVPPGAGSDFRAALRRVQHAQLERPDDDNLRVGANLRLVWRVWNER